MPRRPQRFGSRYLSLATDFGYMLLAAVLLLGGLGYWIDRRRGADVPWFALAGGLLGVAVAFNSLFRGLAALERAEREAKQAPAPPRRPDGGPR